MIFITGPHGAGKTTLAKQLRAKGLIHVETGDIVRQKHQEIAPGTDFHAWVSSQHHRFDDFIAEAVSKARSQVLNSDGCLLDILITGNRQFKGIDSLQRIIPPLTGRPNLIIYVEADENILFHRYINRLGSPVVGLTLARFKEEILGFDTQMGLEKIKDKADLIITNEGDIEYCVAGISTFLEANGYTLLRKTPEGCSRDIESKLL